MGGATLSAGFGETTAFGAATGLAAAAGFGAGAALVMAATFGAGLAAAVLGLLLATGRAFTGDLALAGFALAGAGFFASAFLAAAFFAFAGFFATISNSVSRVKRVIINLPPGMNQLCGQAGWRVGGRPGAAACSWQDHRRARLPTRLTVLGDD